MVCLRIKGNTVTGLLTDKQLSYRGGRRQNEYILPFYGQFSNTYCQIKQSLIGSDQTAGGDRGRTTLYCRPEPFECLLHLPGPGQQLLVPPELLFHHFPACFIFVPRTAFGIFRSSSLD